MTTLQIKVNFTDLQIEYLQFLADGLSYKEIANIKRRGLSSVRAMFTKIYIKFGVNCAPAAVANGFRYGLIK